MSADHIKHTLAREVVANMEAAGVTMRVPPLNAEEWLRVSRWLLEASSKAMAIAKLEGAREAKIDYSVRIDMPATVHPFRRRNGEAEEGGN